MDHQRPLADGQSRPLGGLYHGSPALRMSARTGHVGVQAACYGNWKPTIRSGADGARGSQLEKTGARPLCRAFSLDPTVVGLTQQARYNVPDAA